MIDSKFGYAYFQGKESEMISGDPFFQQKAFLQAESREAEDGPDTLPVPKIVWQDISKLTNTRTVLLYHYPDLYPVVGWRVDDDYYIYEEVGPEDSPDRKYPRLAHKPNHFCELPDFIAYPRVPVKEPEFPRVATFYRSTDERLYRVVTAPGGKVLIQPWSFVRDRARTNEASRVELSVPPAWKVVKR